MNAVSLAGTGQTRENAGRTTEVAPHHNPFSDAGPIRGSVEPTQSRRHSEGAWRSPWSSRVHLCQRCLRLGQPERHLLARERVVLERAPPSLLASHTNAAHTMVARLSVMEGK